MTETERADRLRAIAELAEEIQSGKRAVVSDEQLASDIYAREPSLRAGSPWAVWVRLVRRATTNYGNRRSTGWMPPPVSESKRRAIVAEAIRGGAPEPIEGGGIALSMEIPPGGRVSPHRARRVVEELLGITPREPTPAELAAGFMAGARANMDEERRKEVVEEFRQSAGVRP